MRPYTAEAPGSDVAPDSPPPSAGQAAAAATYPGLAGLPVFITGGGSGIGADMVRGFAAQGARVAFADIAQAPSEALVKELAHRTVAYFPCDVRDIAALKNALLAAQERFGVIKVLVNNAARDDRHALADVTPEYWDENQAVNLRHHFFASQAVAPGMAASGGGSIICMGSVSWMCAMPGMASYTSAKGAINALCRTLARELGPANIRVNCVVPGAILTERQQALWLTPERELALAEKQALDIRLVGDDVARMVLFLASDEARGCTGQNFVVDAGLTLN